MMTTLPPEGWSLTTNPKNKGLTKTKDRLQAFEPMDMKPKPQNFAKLEL